MTILILQNMPDNTLGHLVEVLDVRGIRYQYWNLSDRPAESVHLSEDISGLVILGGSMNVDEIEKYPYLHAERVMIREAIDADLPVFGICLGAQLIARSLGARVEKNPVTEIGWTPIELSPEGENDPVLSVLQGNVSQFQWHEDTFALPPGAVHLAQSKDCARQAFRLKENVYGVQFHPEVTIETIQQWLWESSSLSADKAEAILAETRQAVADRQRLSQMLFHRYCDIAW
jgi:GMP synthase (glutamine-hydrolysing)